MVLSEKQFIFAKNVGKLIDYIFQEGYFCTLGEVYRTPEQAEIYAKQGKGIKNSLHCKKLAIDINLFSPEKQYLTDLQDYEKLGFYWETLHKNNRWGGRFHDANHFEFRDI